MLKSAIPALPVRNLPASATFYQDRAGFEIVHADDDIVILRRDDVVIHLWEANRPETPGAEPFLAGSASCRVVATEVEALYAEYRGRGIVHPNGAIADQW